MSANPPIKEGHPDHCSLCLKRYQTAMDNKLPKEEDKKNEVPRMA